MTRRHAVTPTDRAPDPQRWRETNPDYEYGPPRTSKCGRFVEIDGGSIYDAAHLPDHLQGRKATTTER